MRSLIKTLILFVVLCFSFASVYASESNKILENTPIDVVYKYIDLYDNALERHNKNPKDFDNEELRYSMRSVLKNIPWVRKIFIIMPNERVRFLKDKDEISNKIVYVKDSDLLGFDSSSSITFEFNLWRMKDFGCSDNFIYMNDDYFIGKPLKKSDFFYESGNRIVPYIFSRIPTVGTYPISRINSEFNMYKNILKGEKQNAQTPAFYRYKTAHTFKFLYNVFNCKNLKLCMSTSHNAESCNIGELKEIYDLVQSRYNFADDCLHKKYRHRNQLTHQALYSNYFLNKEHRKVSKIGCVYVDMASSPNVRFNKSLYCINTGGERRYTQNDKRSAKKVMERLFPKKSIYEK